MFKNSQYLRLSRGLTEFIDNSFPSIDVSEEPASSADNPTVCVYLNSVNAAAYLSGIKSDDDFYRELEKARKVEKDIEIKAELGKMQEKLMEYQKNDIAKGVEVRRETGNLEDEDFAWGRRR